MIFNFGGCGAGDDRRAGPRSGVSREDRGHPRKTCRGPGENGLVTEPWMIDELAHAGAEHLDAPFVAGYDRKQGYPDPAEDLAILDAQGLDGA